MRVRHVLVVVVLLALPIGLALVIARSHEQKSISPGGGGTLVGLNLKGGVGEAQVTACGVPHHYTQYRPGDRIHFGGRVTGPPAGKWKVKVKLKTCLGGRFEGSGSVLAEVRSDNTFKGSFAGPVPGYYFARAAVETPTRRVTRSGKQFFQIR